MSGKGKEKRGGNRRIKHCVNLLSLSMGHDGPNSLLLLWGGCHYHHMHACITYDIYHHTYMHINHTSTFNSFFHSHFKPFYRLNC